MSIKRKNILIFGGGALQLSVIKKCREMNLFAVVIDPNREAEGRNFADAFETVEGADFEKTCETIEKHSIDAIITAATDKPLLMMAKAAEKYGFKFFSEETAIVSTDKFLMKKRFQENDIPCAEGFTINEINDSLKYPLILKPRDNSGSRGIIFCRTKQEAEKGLAEAFSFSRKETVLAEEFVGGTEYSIEALHFSGQTRVLQFTEKIVTPHPYNVELGHVQPADLSPEIKEKITDLVENIAEALNFQNCASHTELKINDEGIFIIETSPRLGGDFITSELVPLSTGIDMEKALIEIALGREPLLEAKVEKASAVFYFDLKTEKITDTSVLDGLENRAGVVDLTFSLKNEMPVPEIKNSLDRYGHIILTADDRKNLLELADGYIREIEAGI